MLLVLQGPRIVSSRSHVASNDNVTLTCDTDHAPSFRQSYVWVKNHAVTLPISGRQLHIVHATHAKDGGSYTCAIGDDVSDGYNLIVYCKYCRLQVGR